MEIPDSNSMFKVNNRNTRTRCQLCLKLTMNTPERRQELLENIVNRLKPLTISEKSFMCRSGIFTVNFEHISHLAIVSLLLTLSKEMLAGDILYANTYFTMRLTELL